MSTTVDLYKDAMDMLLAISRTFFIPIDRLPMGLKEAVTSAYLCMRAIDEIEDHPQLSSEVKINLLRSISMILKKSFSDNELMDVFNPYKSLLPEVTLRMGDWTKLSPSSIKSNIYRTTANMAEGMADWVSKRWRIKTEEDLDQYTFTVAGLVGLLLTELWMWYDANRSESSCCLWPGLTGCQYHSQS